MQVNGLESGVAPGVARPASSQQKPPFSFLHCGGCEHTTTDSAASCTGYPVTRVCRAVNCFSMFRFGADTLPLMGHLHRPTDLLLPGPFHEKKNSLHGTQTALETRTPPPLPKKIPQTRLGVPPAFCHTPPQWRTSSRPRLPPGTQDAPPAPGGGGSAP